MFPFLWVPGLSYQLLTATAHNERTGPVLSLTHSLTHQPTFFTNSVCLSHLGTDCTENTVPLLLFATFSVKTCLNSCLSRGRCLATGLLATVLYTYLYNIEYKTYESASSCNTVDINTSLMFHFYGGRPEETKSKIQSQNCFNHGE
jgi:hypothetical protein